MNQGQMYTAAQWLQYYLQQWATAYQAQLSQQEYNAVVQYINNNFNTMYNQMNNAYLGQQMTAEIVNTVAKNYLFEICTLIRNQSAQQQQQLHIGGFQQNQGMFPQVQQNANIFSNQSPIMSSTPGFSMNTGGGPLGMSINPNARVGGGVMDVLGKCGGSGLPAPDPNAVVVNQVPQPGQSVPTSTVLQTQANRGVEKPAAPAPKQQEVPANKPRKPVKEMDMLKEYNANGQDVTPLEVCDATELAHLKDVITIMDIPHKINDMTGYSYDSAGSRVLVSDIELAGIYTEELDAMAEVVNIGSHSAVDATCLIPSYESYRDSPASDTEYALAVKFLHGYEHTWTKVRYAQVYEIVQQPMPLIPFARDTIANENTLASHMMSELAFQLDVLHEKSSKVARVVDGDLSKFFKLVDPKDDINLRAPELYVKLLSAIDRHFVNEFNRIAKGSLALPVRKVTDGKDYEGIRITEATDVIDLVTADTGLDIVEKSQRWETWMSHVVKSIQYALRNTWGGVNKSFCVDYAKPWTSIEAIRGFLTCDRAGIPCSDQVYKDVFAWSDEDSQFMLTCGVNVTPENLDTFTEDQQAQYKELTCRLHSSC